MTNRLSKWSRHSQKMVCLLAACGLMYACKDDYTLDDEKPGWLNASIYESLLHPKTNDTYQTYLRLLGDKQVNKGDRSLIDVLARTGSKTVFVANDKAWEAFFKRNATLPESNPWHYATSYDKLSESQKRLLIHTSMLNNAIVLENLASNESSNNDSPSRGEYMRRYTDVENFDTITYLSPEHLPVTYSPVDKDYWERFRRTRVDAEGNVEEIGGNGLYMVTDSSLSMMVHFTNEHMKKNNIKDEDFKIFMGQERSTPDVHIYNAKIISQDGVCENGYINVTDKPLCPLASMAEAIRVSGKTEIFNHMLDRYSAPFYCDRITKSYQDLHPEFTDSIFNKRYFSELSAGARPLNAEPGPNGTYRKYMPYKDDTSKDIVPALKLDPGWNEYHDPDVNIQKDMGAMFVPNDEALWAFFRRGGGGWPLISTYYIKEGTPEERPYVEPRDLDELYHQIDYIPLGTLQSLINLIMMRSFTGSVPSKMTKLRDDAQEELFIPEDINQIDTCLLANNGVVYVMKTVKGPADYTSVTAPAYISTTNNILKWAIYNGSKSGETDYMGLNYYAYLKAMQSEFSLMLPSDSAMLYYYDPTSMKSMTPRMIKMTYNNKTFPIVAKCFNYTGPYNTKGNVDNIGKEGGQISGNNGVINNGDITNRLKDILESHTIVHDGTNPMLIKTSDNKIAPENATYVFNEYYVSKNGNAVKVIRDENNLPVEIKGGFQLENERNGVAEWQDGVTTCKVKAGTVQANGQTYVLRAPLIPTYRSVWSILTNDIKEWDATLKPTPVVSDEEDWENNPYREFYQLCMYTGQVDENDKYRVTGFDELIKGCGLVDAKLQKNEIFSAMKKFRIFFNTNYSTSDKSGGSDYNVQFFNNYHYTIFVPTNDAIQEAFANGLPSWEDIEDDYNAHRKKIYKQQENEEGELVFDEENKPVYTDEQDVDEDGQPVFDSELETPEDSIRIQTKITYLTNFIRNHFADNSVFVDKRAMSTEEMVTSSYDKVKGLFCKIYVDRIDNGNGSTLRVWDANNNSKFEVVTDDPKYVNVLARDLTCNSAPRNKAMTGITLDASSTAVIHLIPGTLNHAELVGGRHDSKWATPSECRRYLRRYGL